MAGTGDLGGQGLLSRWRLPVVLAVAALVIAGAGTAAVVIRDDDDGAKTRVLGEVVTTSSTLAGGAPEPQASTTSTVVGTTVSASTTTTPRTSTTSRTTTTRRGTATTTSSPACRNSTDPACGPFRWEGVTLNRGLRLEIQWGPGPARVGDVVTFTVTASDPDAGGPGPSEDVAFGDGARQVTTPSLAPCDRFGTWTVPLPTAGHWVRTYTHAYDHAGTFEAAFTLTSATPGLPGCRDESIDVGDPWASTATIRISVTVVAPA